MLTYVFLPAIVTIVEYPFPSRRRTLKDNLESFNHNFGDDDSVLATVLLSPIVWGMIISRFLQLTIYSIKEKYNKND